MVNKEIEQVLEKYCIDSGKELEKVLQQYDELREWSKQYMYDKRYIPLIDILTCKQVYRRDVGYVDVLRVVLNEEYTYPYIELGYKLNNKTKIETLYFKYHYGIKFALTKEELK